MWLRTWWLFPSSCVSCHQWCVAGPGQDAGWPLMTTLLWKLSTWCGPSAEATLHILLWWATNEQVQPWFQISVDNKYKQTADLQRKCLFENGLTKGSRVLIRLGYWDPGAILCFFCCWIVGWCCNTVLLGGSRNFLLTWLYIGNSFRRTIYLIWTFCRLMTTRLTQLLPSFACR